MVIRCTTAVLLLLLALTPVGADAENRLRLVSTDAAVTEVLVMLGVSDQLVALDASSAMPAGQNLPRLGYHRALSAEGLLGLHPDLVIGSESMGPPHVIESMARTGVQTLRLPSPGGLDELEANVQAIAQATGSDRGASLLKQIRDQERQLVLGALYDLRAAFVLRAEGGKLRLAGAGTAGAGFLGLVGAENVAEFRNYRTVTPEAILALDPDMLLFADPGGGDVATLLEAYPVLRFSSAVVSGRVDTIDAATLVAGISISAAAEAQRIQDSVNSGQARR
ncbi:MAG: ABC transporter substrate-binding protein [Gammaproteobacteria bacterium]|nr:ABC transporter substrate-binding protein [Gammaproteobacteria bacterium]